MTKQINKLQLLIIAIATLVSLSITSCSKKKTTAATGTFYFHLHTNIDTNEVDDVTALYPDGSGRHFGLSIAQFYVSGIVLHNVNGQTYTVPDAYILKDIDSEEYVIGTAPVGTYNSVTFNVGVDAASNATTPSSHAASTALGNSAMWFGNTTQGYMFMKLQGFADTTVAQSGSNLVHFSYEIGSSANLKPVTMPTRGTGSYAMYAPYILTSGNASFIHIICDYGKLLSVVNFKTQDSTDTYNINPSLAQSIANNIPNMFSYEE